MIVSVSSPWFSQKLVQKRVSVNRIWNWVTIFTARQHSLLC